MKSLFDQYHQDMLEKQAPLAVRMRPRSLDEYAGQHQAVGKGSWLRHAIEQDKLSSLILYGPAGTGKTSLAFIIAQYTKAAFVEVSAVSGSVKDLREEIAAAKDRLLARGQKTILFVDEIHRFSRSQQDALLHAVENRVLVLIGATTENPYFEVNTALNSRSRIIELTALSDEDLKKLIARALKDDRGLKSVFTISDECLSALVISAGGDARRALNNLEAAAFQAQARSSFMIELEDLQKAVPSQQLSYDKSADQHYDIVSAFIKSMRGSDPDAAVYYLARMLASGEDPKFIARRIMILASEDIGNADPQALCVASAAFKACEVIGMPECRLNLAQAAIYMALAPKSNACYKAYNKALHEVKHGPYRQVPNYLRDRHRPGSKHYGEYKYPHDYPGAYVEQTYLPQGLKKGDFYQASERGWEAFRYETSLRDRFEAQDLKDSPEN